MRKGPERRTQERHFFLAFQDGRADNKSYWSYDEAEKALKKLPEFIQKSAFIVNRWVTIKESNEYV